MVRQIRQIVRAQADGRLEITFPGLPQGREVEVSLTFDEPPLVPVDGLTGLFADVATEFGMAIEEVLEERESRWNRNLQNGL